MTEARAYVYVYVVPPTVQYIQVFLPAKPPLRKECTREMIQTVGVTHRAIKLTPSIRGVVKSACL